jgi:hypothetical protein
MSDGICIQVLWNFYSRLEETIQLTRKLKTFIKIMDFKKSVSYQIVF